MFYFKGSNYATLWQVKEVDKGVLLSFSTSEKRQDNGERVYSSWNGRAYGTTADFLKNLKKGDQFVIKKAKIERVPYEKDGEKIWNHSVVLFEVESMSDSKSSESPKSSKASKVFKAKPSTTAPAEDDDSDPWG